MFKILLALLMLMPSAWATQWRAGTGEQTIDGTSQASLIGYNSYNSIVKPLDNLLATYCNEYLTYNSSSTITVSSGSCVVSNSQGTIRLFLQDTASTNVTSANIDTGSLTSGTKYYVYSTAATNSATSSTYYFSASNTSPSGQTYYYQIGSFTTDSSNQITTINNNIALGTQGGTATSKSSGVTYQALTDGIVNDPYTYSGNSQSFSTQMYSDSSSTPTTLISQGKNSNSENRIGQMIGFVNKGNYYKITDNGNCSHSITFTPTSK